MAVEPAGAAVGAAPDVGAHLEGCAPIGREHAGSLAVHGKIPNVWILAIGDRVIAEPGPELRLGRFTGERHRQCQGHKRRDHAAGSEFHCLILKHFIPNNILDLIRCGGV